MKELPIRRFTTVVGYLSEEVIITKDGKPIGTFTPLKVFTDKVDASVANILQVAKEATMPEEPVKKAIESDKTKVDNSGQLRKGLGNLPGEGPVHTDYGYDRSFRPVPKPGKK